jgi:hypothetical protein
VNLINDLGVIFDTELRFNEHMNYILSKSFKMAGFIMRRCWEFHSAEVLKSLYYSLVRSHLEYCCIVWSPYYKTHIKRIERVQVKYANFILYKIGIDKNLLSNLQRFHLLNMDSLEIRRIYLTLLFGFRLITHDIDSPDLLALINFRVSPRPTRLTQMFSVNRSRTDVGRNNVLNRIMESFNTYIPSTFDFTCSVITFKRNLRRYLDSYPET